MTPNTTNIDPSAIFPLIGGLLVVLVIVWVFAIIAAFFIWRSLKQVSNKSSVGLFGTAGLLLLIGAIIPVFGLILMWISALILAIAFFTLKIPEQPMADICLPNSLIHNSQQPSKNKQFSTIFSFSILKEQPVQNY